MRIVISGTLIDKPFLNPYLHNYLLSIAPAQPTLPLIQDVTIPTSVGLAWIDVSTGEFYTERTIIGALQDELVRISLGSDIPDIWQETHSLLAQLQKVFKNVPGQSPVAEVVLSRAERACIYHRGLPETALGTSLPRSWRNDAASPASCRTGAR